MKDPTPSNDHESVNFLGPGMVLAMSTTSGVIKNKNDLFL